MKSFFNNLLGSLSSQWHQKDQDPQEPNSAEQDVQDAEVVNSAETETPEQKEEHCTKNTTNEPPKKKTVKIEVPPEVVEHKRPTDDIMKCIDQIADGELTRAELEKITGALRRKLKNHGNTKYNPTSFTRKSFTQTPSRIAKVHRDSNYFLNDTSSNLSLFGDNSQQQQQQATNFAPAMFKFDSISTIKPRDEDEEDGEETEEANANADKNDVNNINDNEISAIEPVKRDNVSRTTSSGPIRRSRRRHTGQSVPWSKGDYIQPQPPPSSSSPKYHAFDAIPVQTNLFGFQCEPQNNQVITEGEDKRSFSEALDDLLKKRTSEDESAKFYDFNPEHRAPSPMKDHPLTQGNGMFSSLEPILK